MFGCSLDCPRLRSVASLGCYCHRSLTTFPKTGTLQYLLIHTNRVLSPYSFYSFVILLLCCAIVKSFYHEIKHCHTSLNAMNANLHHIATLTPHHTAILSPPHYHSPPPTALPCNANCMAVRLASKRSVSH